MSWRDVGRLGLDPLKGDAHVPHGRSQDERHWNPPITGQFGTVKIDGLNVAYREAGDSKKAKLVLLHGFPASSHQCRNLIQALANDSHVIAPDYQGFGNSDIPDPATYRYSFDAISETMENFLAAKGFDHYGLFVQEYGGPVGFRIVARNPKALEWLIVVAP